uniref:Uncharacterized protein n=1 Tax=Arundo donax TaxID=35708 RepID=A0A0A9DDU5_ARUDO
MTQGTTTREGNHRGSTPQIVRTQKIRMLKVTIAVQKEKALMVANRIKRVRGQGRRSLVWLLSRM